MAVSLVTGGAGFLGAHVARELLARGRAVLVLDDLSGGREENVPAGAAFVRGSITDHQLVDGLFEAHEIDQVFHLAAYAAEGLSHFIKRYNYTNNLLGSVNLINAAVRHHRCRCFVFTSSIAVYGAVPPPMREDAVPAPLDPYGIAKLAVEQELRVTHEMFGLEYVVFRPHNVYGELQNLGDRYRNVVGIFMNQLMRGVPLSVFGDGEQRRAFSYVGDVAPLIARAPEVPGARNRIFNVGSDTEVSVRVLAEEVMKATGIPGTIRFLPERHEVRHAFADHASLRQVFGDLPETPLADGLARMATWARQAGVQPTPRFTEIEITDQLPAVWLEG
jgi:UDP-glucose 4-epimerase